MGRPKPLLPWADTSIIGHLVSRWQSLGASQVAAVCAADDAVIQSELDRLGFPTTQRIFNPAPEQGMFSSIQRAGQWADWHSELTHWAIVLGDQPHVGIGTLRSIIEFSAAHPEAISMPRQGGHRRHPVLLPKDIFLKLGNSTVANLKDFLNEHGTAVAMLESPDPALALDIDTPEDYDMARRVFPGVESTPLE
jgi:molybdenum cofactor cytidylyltransferase